MKQNKSDILSLSADDHNKQNSTELIEKTKIPNTPFDSIGNKELGYFAALGKYRLTEPQKTKTLLTKYVNSHQWEITLSLIDIVSNYNINNQNKQDGSSKENNTGTNN